MSYIMAAASAWRPEINVSGLPRELTEAVFDQLLDDLVSLSNCTMVCKYWSSISRRMLFRRIHLNYDTGNRRRRSPQKPHPVYTRVWVPDFEGFLSMINSNDVVASYIQVLEITGMAPLESSSLMHANTYRSQNSLPPWDILDPQLLANILCILPSLQHLTLRQVVLRGFDFALPYGNVLPMPRLATLRFENVGVSKDGLVPYMLRALVPSHLYIDAFHAHLDTDELDVDSELGNAQLEAEEPEDLLEFSPALAALCPWSSSLHSLSLSIKSIAQLRGFVHLISTCCRLQDLSLDFSTSAEPILSGRDDCVKTLWQSLDLSNCQSLVRFKARANIGANVNPPSAMKRMCRFISLLPPSVERLALELRCDNYGLALETTETFRNIRQAILPKSSHIGELSIAILESTQELDDEVRLRRDELISTFTDVIPTRGVSLNVQVISTES